MNLAIFAIGTVLAILAARPLSAPAVRQAATVALFGLMLVAPIISNSTSILFDALTAMCIAYGWNVIGGYTGYAAFGNVAYLGLGAFVAAGFMSRQPGHVAWPWFFGIPLAVVIVALVAGAIGLVVLRLRGHAWRGRGDAAGDHLGRGIWSTRSDSEFLRWRSAAQLSPG
jgi:ABC-type branched-subunit amino acid transport system permease subunit